MVLVLINIGFYFHQIKQKQKLFVGEANGSNYEALGQDTVHVYSTMQNRELLGHGSNYEAFGQGTVHVYFTMQNRDLN